VSFFLGCSFGFEHALQEGGIEVRNITEGKNVSMYTTNIQVRRPSSWRYDVGDNTDDDVGGGTDDGDGTTWSPQCTPVGPFNCPMVVSMRPIPVDKVETAIQVTGTRARPCVRACGAVKLNLCGRHHALQATLRWRTAGRSTWATRRPSAFGTSRR